MAVSLILLPGTCWAWGSDGHQIIAYIAADHLSPVARRHVAQILGVADDPTAVADAMARAAIRPDVVFRSSAPETLDWHFINLCRQDTRADVQARCPNGACLTAQIDRFVDDLAVGQERRQVGFGGPTRVRDQFHGRDPSAVARDNQCRHGREVHRGAIAGACQRSALVVGREAGYPRRAGAAYPRPSRDGGSAATALSRPRHKIALHGRRLRGSHTSWPKARLTSRSEYPCNPVSRRLVSSRRRR